MTGTMTRVMTKARKHSPSVPTVYLVKLVKQKSIKIFREDTPGVIRECKMFRIGDQAEYDSFNLSYYGEIQMITENRVVIMEKYSTRKHYLDLNSFCWRNHNFDLGDAQARNSETMNYI